METLIEEKIQRQNVRTVPGTPYNLRETLKWFAKHSVYDLFYPLTLLAFLLIAINTIEWYYTLIYLIIISVGLGFLFFIWIETHLIKIPSIGSCFENKWWQEKFNDLDEIIADIGFVGDIMKIKDYRLFFNNSIKEFFHNVDLMVGNLEGIINDSKPAHFLQQKHKSTILNYLKDITDTNPQWLLCVSNNHGADFKKADFKLSYKYINKIPSFSSFGSIDHQNFIFRDEINIVSGTIWNNFSNNYLAQFADRNQFFKKGKFNILFPHWHYENECYVRNDLYYKAISLLITGFYFPIHKLKSKLILIRRSKFYKNFKEMPIILGTKTTLNQLLNFENVQYKRKYKKLEKRNNGDMEIKKWNLIFGHHSHVPQAVIKSGDGLIAFSGGNFTSPKRWRYHKSGLILRCEIGRKSNNRDLIIGNVYWSYVINERNKEKKEITVNVDKRQNKLKKFDFRPTKFILNIFCVSMVYLIIVLPLSMILFFPLTVVFIILMGSIGLIIGQFFLAYGISYLFLKIIK